MFELCRSQWRFLVGILTERRTCKCCSERQLLQGPFPEPDMLLRWMLENTLFVSLLGLVETTPRVVEFVKIKDHSSCLKLNIN